MSMDICDLTPTNANPFDSTLLSLQCAYICERMTAFLVILNLHKATMMLNFAWFLRM